MNRHRAKHAKLPESECYKIKKVLTAPDDISCDLRIVKESVEYKKESGPCPSTLSLVITTTSKEDTDMEQGEEYPGQTKM